MVRKPEKGTGPKIFYLGAEESVDPAGSLRCGRSITRKARSTCGRSARRCRIRTSPGDPRVDYDVPHGKPWGVDMVLYLLFKAISHRRDVARGAALVARRSTVRSSRLAAPVDLARLRHADGGRAHRRSRTAGALLLHPHAAELAFVDGVGRVLPHRARRDQRARGSPPAGSAGRRRSTWLARAGDRRRDSARPPTPASCSRRVSARDLWQGPQRPIDLHRAGGGGRRRVAAARRGAHGRRRAGRDPLARHGSLALASLRAPRHPAVRARAVAEPDAPPRARGRDRSVAAPTRGCSGAARSPAAACCRSLLLVDARRHVQLVAGRASPPLLALAGGAAWEYIWVEADSRCRYS